MTDLKGTKESWLGVGIIRNWDLANISLKFVLSFRESRDNLNIRVMDPGSGSERAISFFSPPLGDNLLG